MARCEAVLWLVGVPLTDSEVPSQAALSAIAAANLWIGESRRRVDWFLRKAQVTPDPDALFHLDPLPPPEEKALKARLKEMGSKGGNVVLFSDTGMPVLFDPGSWILETCRALGFQVRTVAGPCSWSTACVISGYKPPFWIEGFLPRENEQRGARLKTLATTAAHIVLLDTPYRFLKLVEECSTQLKADRELFLAWEIGSQNEKYFWGDARGLQQFASKHNLSKGEFILIVKKFPEVRK